MILVAFAAGLVAGAVAWDRAMSWLSAEVERAVSLPPVAAPRVAPVVRLLTYRSDGTARWSA